MRSNGTRKQNVAAAAFMALFSIVAVPICSQSQNLEQSPEVQIIVVDSRAQAEQILKRLQAGEDFATVARQESIDPSAANGGALGRVDPATLRTELREAFRGMKAGQLAGPVKISNGYAVLKVEEGVSSQSDAAASTPGAAQTTPPVVSSGQG